MTQPHPLTLFEQIEREAIRQRRKKTTDEQQLEEDDEARRQRNEQLTQSQSQSHRHAERAYLESSTLTAMITAQLKQLKQTQIEMNTTRGTKQTRGQMIERRDRTHTHHSGGSTNLNDSDDLLNDLILYWQLIQAEEFLQLEGSERRLTQSHTVNPSTNRFIDHGLNQSNQPPLHRPQPSTTSSTHPPINLFGVDWQSLTRTFQPSSTAIPTNPFATNTPSNQRTPNSTHHSFTDPSASSLQANFHALLVPALESAFEDRVNQLWNEFDPTGIERRQAEEEAAAAAAQAKENRTVTTPAVNSHPVLNSSDLSSLIRFRLNQLQLNESQIEEELNLTRVQESVYHTTLSDSLKYSALLLTQHQLQSARGQECQQSISWLRAKLGVIGAKLNKLETELKRDTYLGLTNNDSTTSTNTTTTSSHPHPSGSSPSSGLILPSLQLIHDQLLSIHTRRTNEVKERQRQLSSYQMLGVGFYQLADEFGSIQRQIENKKWTIKELHQHQRR